MTANPAQTFLKSLIHTPHCFSERLKQQPSLPLTPTAVLLAAKAGEAEGAGWEERGTPRSCFHLRHGAGSGTIRPETLSS